MEVLTYAPSNIVLLISGYEIKGWNEIKITRNSPGFKQIRGIRGKNTRTRIKDTSAVMTIQTYQTELLNQVMGLIYESDLVNGTCRLEITLRDLTSSSFFGTTTGYILNSPDMNNGRDVGTVTWTIACDETQMIHGCAVNAAIGIVENGVSRLKDFASSAVDSVSGIL